MTRGAKLALIAVGVIGLIVVGTFALLSSREVTTRLGHEVLRRLDQQIPADVTFTHLSVNPGTGEIAVDDLAITIPNKPQEKFLASRQVIVDVGLGALWGGKVKIERIHLVNPEATIIHRGQDRYNFQEVLPAQEQKKEEQKESFLTLDQVTFEGGRVTYLDAPRRLTAEVPHLKGSLELDIRQPDNPSVGGQITFSDGWARYEDLKQPVESFLADFKLANRDLTFDKLKVDAGDTGLGVSGAVRGIGLKDRSPRLALDGTLKTKLAQWAPWAKVPMSGFAQADFSVSGTADAPRVAATVEGTRLAVRAVKIDDLETRLTASRESVAVHDLDARLWGGVLTARGTVPTQQRGPLDLTATAEGLDLAMIVRQLEVKTPGPVSGTASARVTATGDGLDPERIEAAGWLRASGRVPVQARSLPLAARTDFRWARRLLSVSNLELKALGGRVTGRGQIAPLAKVPTYSAKASVRGLEAAALQPFLEEPLPVTGTLTADLSVVGRGFENPALDGSAQLAAAGALKPGSAGNKAAVPFKADARLGFDGRRLRVNAFSARALGGSATGSGTVALGGRAPRIELQATARGIDLAALDAAFELAEGPLSGRADATVSYAGDALTIRALEARTLGGQILASGRVDTGGREPRYSLRVVAAGLDLAALDAAFAVVDVPIRGQAGASMAVTGVGDQFRAAGPISLRGTARVPAGVAGAVRTLPFRLKGEVAVTPKSARLAPLEAQMGNSLVTARGTIDLGGRSDLTFEGRLVDTPAIAALFGVDGLQGGEMTLRGAARGSGGQVRFSANVQAGATRLGSQLALSSGTLALQGTMNGALSVSGHLAARDVAVQDQTFQTVETPFTYRAFRDRPGAGLLRLPQLQAVLAQGGRVAGSGFVDLNKRTYAVRLDSERLTLAALGAERLKAAGLSADTPVTLKVSGSGPLSAPVLDATVDLGAFAYRDQAFGASRLKASVRGDRLAVTGELFQEQVKVTGAIGTRGGPSGTVTLRFDRARLDPLFAMLPPGVAGDFVAPQEGLLTGTITLKGPFGDPDRLAAEVDLSLFRIAYENLMLANQGPIRLSYAGRVLEVRQFHMLGPETDLTARGRIGLGVPSNLNVDGRVNLAILEKASPKQFADAAGVAVIEAQLQGTLGQPDLVGALSIREGELSTRNLPQAIRDLNGSVRLVRDRVFLDGLSATLGYTGRVQAFGGATLGPDFQPTQISLQMSAKEVELRLPEARVLANADLSFTGTPDASRLDGQVRVLEGRYTQNIDLTGRLAARGGRAGGAAPAEIGAMPFLKNLGLRVQVVVPDQFVVKNNLAEAELRGDLVVLGNLMRPVLVGRAEALSGKVTFQDQTYTLEEASVDFIDPHKLVPYAHVIATTSAQGYDIRVQANGTPDALQLDLTSTPFLPQSDVLTLLATGQTPAQLQQAGGEGIATAGNFLLGQVAKGVERGVTGQGVVDVLRIQPGSVNPAEPGGGSFTVGKRLSDRLMVTYTQDITVAPGETPGRVVIFDYLVTDEIVLKLEQNLGGGFNGSARYRFTVR